MQKNKIISDVPCHFKYLCAVLLPPSQYVILFLDGCFSLLFSLSFNWKGEAIVPHCVTLFVFCMQRSCGSWRVWRPSPWRRTAWTWRACFPVWRRRGSTWSTSAWTHWCRPSSSSLCVGKVCSLWCIHTGETQNSQPFAASPCSAVTNYCTLSNL